MGRIPEGGESQQGCGPHHVQLSTSGKLSPDFLFFGVLFLSWGLHCLLTTRPNRAFTSFWKGGFSVDGIFKGVDDLARYLAGAIYKCLFIWFVEEAQVWLAWAGVLAVSFIDLS